ncbi:MAG: FKBP-type peptidyl-prolyl cis-trans isomerase [Muribaculaceae bacterium]|nr:FKBP-type peptidyl-prolyl cis-trans isomerase [Muribaculaceae bacterium]
MRKLVYLIFLLPLVIGYLSSSCSNSNDNWEDYEDWRVANEKWMEAQAARADGSGNAYYQRIVPAWNPGVYILMHTFNDKAQTQGNLVPLMSSTVAVKYKGMFFDDVPFDSSYLSVDSLYTTKLTNVIEGWQIALQNMHVGDSVEVLLPYQVAYGASGSAAIKPYSALKFHIKLVNIPAYQIR